MKRKQENHLGNFKLNIMNEPKSLFALQVGDKLVISSTEGENKYLVTFVAGYGEVSLQKIVPNKTKIANKKFPELITIKKSSNQ